MCHVNMLKAYHSRESSRMDISVADDVATPVPVSVAAACTELMLLVMLLRRMMVWCSIMPINNVLDLGIQRS